MVPPSREYSVFAMPPAASVTDGAMVMFWFVQAVPGAMVMASMS